MNNGDLNKTPPAAATEETIPSSLARASSSEEFGRAVANIAVAQVCESLGFDGTRSSALDALADIAIRCVRNIGKSSAFYANLSSRTQCSEFDVLRSFDDLGVSNSRSPLMEIVNYVMSCEELPFTRPIPQFPVVRNDRKPTIPSFLQIQEAPPEKHIPSWLPALPDMHTYKSTPTWKERNSDTWNEKLEQARQRRKAERSLLNLQQRLAHCGASTSVVASKCNQFWVQGGNGKNPYLAAPLEAGEKGIEANDATAVWSNEMVKEMSFNIMETFSPAIEVMKDKFCEDVDTDMKSMLPDKRPAVQFRFKTSKKVFGQAYDVNLWNRCHRRPSSTVLWEDERDDRKRRVEYILRQADENPYELNQW